MEEFIKELENDGNPFVIFRLPNENRITLYYQLDSTVYKTKDSLEGFVFNSFDSKHFFIIPSTHQQNLALERKEKEVSMNNFSLKQEKQDFISIVEKAKQKIDSGTIEKVVLSELFKVQLEEEVENFDVFQNLCYLYPSSLVYYWNHSETGEWLGATPEKLIELDENELQTISLAGTKKESSKENTWTNKEIKEQEIVTNYILKRLSDCFPKASIEKGKREELNTGNLKHLSTKIKATDDSFDWHTCAALLHPTPAVAGTPIAESLNFIEQYENHKRLFYSGYLGIVEGKKKANLYVNLRCAKREDTFFSLFAGAGITNDSDPNAEYKEVINKIKIFLAALNN